jgi:FkbM family methyltransferase
MFSDKQLSLYKDFIGNNNVPHGHFDYLKTIKSKYNFEPRVIYDIGCCVLHWTKFVEKIWPNSEFILFDVMEEAEFLYKEYKYNIGVLGEEDNKVIDFYQNDYAPAGNSRYKEIGSYDHDILFNDSHKILKTIRTLDSIIKEKNFPLPDLIKIDVQGCEIDILKGAKETLRSCKHLIVELQHQQYNLGAPLSKESIPFIESIGFKLVTPLFQNNGPDGDYHFINTNTI